MILGLAFVMTVVVEGVIASAILRRFPILETIAIQLTTWPVAQWLLLRTGAFWPIEIGVVTVEIVLWRIVLPMPLHRAALVSIAANGVTIFLALALF